MSELIRRLRDEPNWHYIRRHGLPLADSEVWHKTCCDGADEIEHLQARNEVLEKVLEAAIAMQTSEYFQADIAETLVKTIAAASPKRDKQGDKS